MPYFSAVFCICSIFFHWLKFSSIALLLESVLLLIFSISSSIRFLSSAKSVCHFSNLSGSTILPFSVFTHSPVLLLYSISILRPSVAPVSTFFSPSLGELVLLTLSPVSFPISSFFTASELMLFSSGMLSGCFSLLIP